jgi:hypothetical protein
MMYDVEHDVLMGDHGKGLIITRQQEIPEEYLRELRDAKDAQDARFAPDMLRVASIPVVVVEKWLRQGFDIYRATLPEIMAMLRKEELDAFVTTRRRVA